MTRSMLPALIGLVLAVSACGTRHPAPGSQSPTARAAGAASNVQLELALANGTYRCENGERIRIERERHDRVNQRIQIDWNGKHYRLERDRSYSGLPRFADVASGLVWIDMPAKSLLLDGKLNKPLANECRPV